MRILQKLALPSLALTLSFGMVYTLRAQTTTDQDADQPSFQVMLELLRSVMQHVENYYVEPMQSPELMEAALKGMLSSLDPYSDFMTPKDMQELSEETSGKYGGLGMQVGIRDGWPTVIAPFEGTPAYKKGLRPGDKIIEIEGESTYDMSINEVVKRLKGPKGTKVTIKVIKPGAAEAVEITLTRDTITVHPVPYYGMVESDIGYVKLNAFSEEASSELMNALDSLEAQGAHSIILDLRGNPGGLLREAVNVCDLFLDKNSLIVSTKGRGSEDVLTYFARQQPEIPQDQKIVVLVDNGSASASEIVSGALQDWDRALILGDTTFGKGLVQRVFPLEYNYALRLTTSRYYTPSGRCINRINKLGGKSVVDSLNDMTFHTKRLEREVKGGGGIIPDVVIEPEKFHQITAEVVAKGLVFKYAVEYAKKHDAPGSGLIKLSDRDMEKFKDFLISNDMDINECQWEQAKDQLRYFLQQDIAEKYWGLKGRYRQSLVGDPMTEEAVKRLKRAKDVDMLLIQASKKEK